MIVNEHPNSRQGTISDGATDRVTFLPFLSFPRYFSPFVLRCDAKWRVANTQTEREREREREVSDFEEAHPSQVHHRIMRIK